MKLLTLKVFVILASISAQPPTETSGTAEVPGTYEYSFDKGALIFGDVYWAHWEPSAVFLAPYLNSGAANLGIVNFSEVTPAQLYQLNYSPQHLDSAVVQGNIFAVHTNGGNFTKALIKRLPEGNGGLLLEWVTYEASTTSTAKIVSSGGIELLKGCRFSFDVGAAADVLWRQDSPTRRFLVPTCAAGATNLGTITFSSLSLAELEKFTYGDFRTHSINGSDAENILIPGDVFAVHTSGGNYVKALVTRELDQTPNHGLALQWVRCPPK